jgi:phage baseplate assembly protein V
MIGRGVVKLINDGLKLQHVQISLLAEEVHDDVERFQNYGFTSVPFPGAEALVVAVGGDRGHSIVVAVDDRRYRLQGLEQGEVALYTDEGDQIVLRRGGQIEIRGGTSILLKATEVRVEGNLSVKGTVRATGDVADSKGEMEGIRGTFNVHVHTETGTNTLTPTPRM